MSKNFVDNTDDGKIISINKFKTNGDEALNCKLIISCRSSSVNSELLDVDFSYDGDKYLAAFLLEYAREFIEHEF